MTIPPENHDLESVGGVRLEGVSTGALFDPTTLGPVPLVNRVAVAPMTRISADERGVTTDRHAHYYSGFAYGGFGLVITEGIYPDDEYSQGYENQPGLADREQARSWGSVVAAVHSSGSTRMVAQLMHAGGQSQGNRYRTGTVGPSDVPPRGAQLGFYRGSGPFPAPRSLTLREIATIRQGFVAAARRAREAGFAGVEIHGANGYLLDQFLTEYTNQRTDRYGGSVGSRVRLVAEVCDDVLQAVGADIAVGVRISQTKVADSEHRWAGAADADLIFGRLAEIGVHWIHTTERDATAPAFRGSALTLAEYAARSGVARVIANGGLGDPLVASSVIGSGRADVVSLGAPALADRCWPRKVRAGQPPVAHFPDDLLRPFADLKDSELGTVEWRAG